MPKQTIQQYIVLPPRGLTAGGVLPSTPSVTSFLLSLNKVRMSGEQTAALASAKIKTKLQVLDSIGENGAKLVEMSPESVSNLRAEQPGLRVVPVVYYFPAIAPRPVPAARPKAAAAALKISLTVVSKSDGKPIGSADVVAFTDFANRVGAGGKTNSKGIVSLSLGAASKKVERLYIYSEKGFWNVLKKNITLTTGLTVPMLPIALSFTDSLRHFYGNSPDDTGEKVKVGVIDTGIAAHPDLVIDGGENTVVGEDPQDFGDNGDGHGTHVAGIIAARGNAAVGYSRIGPGGDAAQLSGVWKERGGRFQLLNRESR